MHPLDDWRITTEPFYAQQANEVTLFEAAYAARLPVMVSGRVQPGELFTSFHFPDTDLNVLLSSSADESSKCPEYKVSTVRIEKILPAGTPSTPMRVMLIT